MTLFLIFESKATIESIPGSALISESKESANDKARQLIELFRSRGVESAFRVLEVEVKSEEILKS